MLTLAWPWLLAGLPLPWLIRNTWRPLEIRRDPDLFAPTLPYLKPDPMGRAGLTLYLALLAWGCLCLALARPQWLGEPVSIPQTHRDLMLAVDLSDSMRTRDMRLEGETLNRLEAVKRQLIRFAARRAGDRMGLILFADHAYVMMPLSTDWQTLTHFIQELDFGLAGHLTAIGEAIGLSLRRLEQQHSQQKVLILLSDGRETVDTVAPLAAAEVAARQGMRIYTIGLGAEGDTSSDLDEQTLSGIAALTDGRYFRARDTASLSGIYTAIDALEPIGQSQHQYQPRRELYAWPLGMGLLLVLLLLWRQSRG